MPTAATLYAIAAKSYADVKSVRKWVRGGVDRERMKPSCRVRIERAAEELGLFSSSARISASLQFGARQ